MHPSFPCRTLALLGLMLSCIPAFAAQIRIDLSTGGEFPELWRPALFVGYANQAAMRELFALPRLGMTRIEIESAIADSRSMDDYLRRLRGYRALIDRIRAKGGKVLVQISKVPRWLSSDPSDRELCNGWKVYQAAPPRDPAAYGELVRRTVEYFNGELGYDLYYESWAEPDLEIGGRYCNWSGSQAQMVQLLREIALGARRGDPKARLVLPATGAWWSAVRSPLSGEALREDFGRSLIAEVLGEFARTRGPDGTPLRPDFVSFHSFGPRRNLFAQGVRKVRARLDELGFDRTGLIISEWNAYLDKPLLNMAFYPGMLKYFLELGVDYATFASLQDFRPLKIGARDYGMLTRTYTIRKPVFHVLELQARMDGQWLEVRREAEVVDAVASRDGERLYLLVWNYVDPLAQVQDFFIERGLARSLKEKGIDRRRLQAWITGRGSLPAARLSAGERSQLEEARALFNRLRSLSRTPREVAVELTGTDLESMSWRRWTVDARTNNPFAVYREATQRGASRDEAIARVRERNELQPGATGTWRRGEPFVVEVLPNSVQMLVFDLGEGTGAGVAAAPAPAGPEAGVSWEFD